MCEAKVIAFNVNLTQMQEPLCSPKFALNAFFAFFILDGRFKTGVCSPYIVAES